MFDRNELKEIAKMHDSSDSFSSLYLNVNPLTNPKGEYVIQFKNMIKQTIEAIDKGVYTLIKDDLEKMESSVIGNKRQFKKGVAILSSARHSLWKEYYMSVPVKNELIVDKSPYIKPLFDILDNYQKYAVLLVDKGSARIFTVHLGEIVEYGEVHTSDIPGKHKKGGWFALSQNHYERHIDYHLGLHIKDVVKKLGSFMSEEHIERLLIGGSDDAMAMTKNMLPVNIVNKVIGTFHTEMFAKNDTIISKVENLIRSFEKQKKDETVDGLITQAMKGESAVLGLESVLGALRNGNVMKLVFIHDLKSDGQACNKCGFFTIQDIKQCPYCKGGMEKVNYIVDMAAQKAVEQGSIIEVVAENRKLSESGGIGAFLRF